MICLHKRHIYGEFNVSYVSNNNTATIRFVFTNPTVAVFLLITHEHNNIHIRKAFIFFLDLIYQIYCNRLTFLYGDLRYMSCVDCLS